MSLLDNCHHDVIRAIEIMGLYSIMQEEYIMEHIDAERQHYTIIELIDR